MKTPLLISLLALSGSAAFAADTDAPPSKPGANPPAAVTGKATITIEVNGKKETREVDLGNAAQIKVGDGGGVTIKGDAAKPKTPAVQRTWLGVATDEPSDEVRAQLPIANGTGLLVREVVAGSPAAKAGLETNDILVRLDDQILTNPDQLRKLIGMKKDGDAVHMAYLRKGQEATAEVKLGTHAEDDAADFGDKTGKLLFNNLYTTAMGNSGSGSVASGAGSGVGPIIIQRNAAFDKDGNLFFTTQNPPGAGQGGPASNKQWHLITKNGHADVTETMKRLEKTLRDAGVNEEVIAQTREAVAEAVAQMQQAVSDASAPKLDIQRNAQKAAEEVRRALERAQQAEEAAHREVEEAARKAQPAPPAAKAP